MTQRDTVLRHLRNHPSVCGTTFLAHGIPRYAARILELKQRGLEITTRPCENTWHSHGTRQVEYVLEGERLFV